MNVTVTDAGPCRKVLKIEMPAERVKQERDQVLSLFAKSAKIPGFRPGKAPVNVVERRYAKEIDEEVRDRLIPQGYHDALKEQKINPVEVVGVDDVSMVQNGPLQFNVTLDVPPEFTLPNYKGIALQGRKVEVTDADIDETFKQLLEQRSKWEDVAGRPVQKGDLVKIDYKGECEGKPLEEVAPKAAGLGTGADFWMRADENAFLPGFGEGLIGTEVGGEKAIQVEFPADFVEGSVAGKECAYTVQVKAIKERKLPDVDKEFLDAFEAESEAALRAKIREELLQSRENSEKGRQKDEILKWLLDNTMLDVPASIVQRETRDIVYDIVRQNSYRGISREVIEEKKDEIFETASRNANEKVKIRYILHRIGESENIQVSDEEVAERVAQLAQRFNVTPQEFRAELDKRNGVETVVEEIRMGKTLDLLLAQANVRQ